MPIPACRILITGAEGFVGRALAARIKANDPHARLIGTSRAPSTPTHCHETLVLDLVNGDVGAAIRHAQPDLVLHLAARSSVAQGLAAAGDTFDDNVTGCIRLAKALRDNAAGVPLVFASSGEIYGASFNLAQSVTEQVPPAPQNAYARSKLAGEFAFTDLLSARNPVTILRLFNHFGPGQDERFVIPAFAGQLRRIRDEDHAPIIRVGNLAAERDFLPVSDVLDAYLLAITQCGQSPAGLKIYNICSGQSRTIRSILDDLIRLSGQHVKIEMDPNRMRASDIPVACGDSSSFAAATGWEPTADWDSALAGMLTP